MSYNYLYYIPLLPLIGFLINGSRAFLTAHQEKGSSEKLTTLIAVLGPLLAFGLAVKAFFDVKATSDHLIVAGPLFSWIDSSLVNVSFTLMVDQLSSVMLLVVTGVGTLIHIYASGYMHDDRSFTRFFSYLNLFLFFMLILVLGDNLLALFVGWEGVGLCSYLLIGFWFEDVEKAKCGKKAFIVNRIGDLGFLAGLFFIVYAFTEVDGLTSHNFFDYDFLRANVSILAPYATIIGICLFIGATGKSAQIPLYVWLPDAMAGPTPVSALIHAATMVTAGVYMVARLFFIYELSPLALDVIASVGLATALMAALIAIVQTDIKKVLAYSTVSQLGYMFLALGVGAPQSAIFHVVTHAFFKACLFLGAGSVIHALHHEQDIRNMGGLLKKMPATGYAFLVSTLAIAGFPFLSGFFSKDEILFNTYLNAPLPFYIIALLTAGLTAFYMMRLFVYAFLGEGPRKGKVHSLPKAMDWPVMILALLALFGGLMGVPAILGGDHHFYHWLEYLSKPVDHSDHHTLEYILMGVSSVWAILALVVAYLLYSKNLNWTHNLKHRFVSFYHLLKQKFYVDEIYEKVIVKPIHVLSENLLFKVIDRKIIDGILVHGGADFSLLSARILRWWQTGLITHYLKFFWIGLIIVLIYLLKAL